MGTKKRSLIFALFTLCLFFFISCAGKTVSFESSSTYEGEPVELQGSLSKPEGDGPFPAVVLLHGCGGIMDNRQDFWVKKLNAMGYATFQLDSLTPRNIYGPALCKAQEGKIKGLDYKIRAQDAFDAKSHLQSLPFIDANNIAIMGFSHGAISALEASKAKFHFDEKPFSAIIALYPYCFEDAFSEYDAPILVIIGEDDDWTPAELCKQEFARRDTNAPHDVTLEVLPGLTHCFDCVGARNYLGHQQDFSREGREKALQLVKPFLHQHMR